MNLLRDLQKVKKEKPDSVPLPDENIEKVKKIEE